MLNDTSVHRPNNSLHVRAFFDCSHLTVSRGDTSQTWQRNQYWGKVCKASACVCNLVKMPSKATVACNSQPQYCTQYNREVPLYTLNHASNDRSMPYLEDSSPSLRPHGCWLPRFPPRTSTRAAWTWFRCHTFCGHISWRGKSSKTSKTQTQKGDDWN